MRPPPTESESVRFLIIGAGPTGLGAAYRLAELGIREYLVVDAARHVGGLAASFRDPQGFVWDIGGHVQFSHYPYFDRVMDAALGVDGWVAHERESWVWIRDRFVPYPFQNNIRHLPKDDLLRCIKGLFELRRVAGEAPRPHHFRDWIRASFGPGLASVFMEPYNFKVWGYPPEEMSYEWVGDRVATVDLERILENLILERDDLSWGPNHTFRFPKSGGTGAIWERVADLCDRSKIRLGFEVVEVRAKDKWVRAADGRTVHFDAVLTTMPLDLLAGMTRELTGSSKTLAGRLRFSSSNLVGVGLEGPKPDALATKCWIYFPEADCPFYRVTVFSNYAPANVPDASRHWSLLAETSESPVKPVDRGRLVGDTIEGLRNTRLLDSRSRIVSTWSFRARHGYPTPSLERNGALGALNAELEALGVFSRGRFGGWKYEVSNQDHSLMQGVEWVNRVVFGDPEVTLFDPAKVNANGAGAKSPAR